MSSPQSRPWTRCCGSACPVSSSLLHAKTRCDPHFGDRTVFFAILSYDPPMFSFCFLFVHSLFKFIPYAVIVNIRTQLEPLRFMFTSPRFFHKKFSLFSYLFSKSKAPSVFWRGFALPAKVPPKRSFGGAFYFSYVDS